MIQPPPHRAPNPAPPKAVGRRWRGVAASAKRRAALLHSKAALRWRKAAAFLLHAWRIVRGAPAIARGLAFGVGTLAFAVLGADAARSLSDAKRPHTLAAELPAAAPPSISWDAETAAFAERKTMAFGLPPKVAREFAGWILEAAARQGLSPELLASVVLAESAFRKDARSVVGAFGPAQVRIDYWRAFCGGDLKDPAENIYCGAQILATFEEACGGSECALRMYNVGPRNANRSRWVPAGSRYVAKIENGLAQLNEVAL